MLFFVTLPTKPQDRQIVKPTSRSVTATALALIGLLVVRPTSAQAQQHSMAGMNHIMVPEGAAYTVADVEFMQGMIAHHAQAIYMSRLASSHGANAKLSSSRPRSISRRLPRFASCSSGSAVMDRRPRIRRHGVPCGWRGC